MFLSKDEFYSTYAKIILGLSEAIAALVVKYARQSSSKLTSVLPITLLTEDQVNQALGHPQNDSLKNLIATAYKDSVDATHYINISVESIDDQRMFIEETLNTLQTKLAGKVTPATKESIETTKNALNQQLRVINTLQERISGSEEQLTATKAEIDTLATTQDDQWSAFREKRLSQLKTEIEALLKGFGLQLLPGEIDNLERQDLQEVHDRYIDLGVGRDLPEKQMEKLLVLKNPDFATYFRVKAYMAIRSAHPSSDQAVKMMQQLNTFFDQSKQEAKELDSKQKVETEIVQRKVKPLLQAAITSSQELGNLQQERTVLLTKVASIRGDLDSIQEKIQQRIDVTPQPN